MEHNIHLNHNFFLPFQLSWLGELKVYTFLMAGFFSFGGT